jgi:hypothetical protein
MYPSVILLTWTFFVLHSATSHALLVPPSYNASSKTSVSTPRNAICQQNLAQAPPMPILDIGLQHMLGQMGVNATKAENDSIAEANDQPPPPEFSRFTLPNQKDAPAQCGPGQPCADGSCCNSVSDAENKPWISLTANRKGSVDIRPTIVTRLLQRRVSRIAMLMLCVEWTRFTASRNAR